MIHKYNDKFRWGQTSSGLIIPADDLPPKRPVAFDFFAGCGGFSCGVHQAGFHVIGAVEMDKYAAHTYMVNLGNYPMKIHFDTAEREADFENYMKKLMRTHIKRTGVASLNSFAGSGWISRQSGEAKKGCEHFWIADICNLTGKQLLDVIGMEVGELDLIVGGPPCQGFSRAGKQDESDARNNLVFEYARMIVEMKPKTFMMENVPEIVKMHTPDGISIIDGFQRILADGNYASFESLQKSLLGRRGAKAVVRQEKMERKKKMKAAKKETRQPSLMPQPTTAQQSLF